MCDSGESGESRFSSQNGTLTLSSMIAHTSTAFASLSYEIDIMYLRLVPPYSRTVSKN